MSSYVSLVLQEDRLLWMWTFLSTVWVTLRRSQWYYDIIEKTSVLRTIRELYYFRENNIAGLLNQHVLTSALDWSPIIVHRQLDIQLDLGIGLEVCWPDMGSWRVHLQRSVTGRVPSRTCSEHPPNAWPRRKNFPQSQVNISTSVIADIKA